MNCGLPCPSPPRGRQPEIVRHWPPPACWCALSTRPAADAWARSWAARGWRRMARKPSRIGGVEYTWDANAATMEGVYRALGAGAHEEEAA